MAIPIKEEAKGIFRLGALETGRPSANTSPFLVVGEERAAIVEPGEEGQAPQLLEGIKQLGVGLDRVAYVIASHIHLHHIQGVPTLLKGLPQAKFVVHPRGAPHVIEPTRLIESTLAIFGPDCYRPMTPVPADRVMPVNDGQVLGLGGRELEIIWSPGHAPHHMCIFDRLTRVVFAGDAFGTGEGSFGRPGRPGDSPTMYNPDMAVASLHRLRDLKPSIFLVFGQRQPLPAEDTLKGGEANIRAIERICLEGMRQKVGIDELDRRCDQFADWVRTERVEGYDTGFGALRRRDQGAPPALVQYLRRQDPSLEMPAGAEQKTITSGHRWRTEHPKS